MNDAGVLVIGGGQAASQVAVSLREFGYECPVRIVGEEFHSPYQRPPLSKAFLAGKADASTLAFRSDDYYRRHDIDLHLGQRIDDVELDARGTGGVARSADGNEHRFSRLVLAVGAEPRQLDVPGSDLGGIVYLRDLADADVLKSRIERSRDVVVVGGGFIGLEAAAVARARGCTVTVVEYGERLMARAVAPVVSEFYRAAHERRGTSVLLSAEVCGFSSEYGDVCAVLLADGHELAADLVVVGVGVTPRLELAKRLGLTCVGGIVVDEHARTSHPAVLAAGDCTVTSHPRSSGGPVRLESVQNAVDQAKCVAATIVGLDEPYATVPWFWSDQDTLKLQIAGLSAGFDKTVMRGDPEHEKFALFYYRDGKLIAVDAVNSPREFMAVKRALSEDRNITPDEAADAANPLKRPHVASA